MASATSAVQKARSAGLPGLRRTAGSLKTTAAHASTGGPTATGVLTMPSLRGLLEGHLKTLEEGCDLGVSTPAPPEEPRREPLVPG